MSAALDYPAPALQNTPSPAGGLRALFGFFREQQRLGAPLVLATILSTAGTTYRKRGAHMLIRNDDHWHGLLSGGCLEGDLAARAREVFANGQAQIITYDLAAMTDVVWGFGLGCDGSVRILLQRLNAQTRWEPFASIIRCVESGTGGTLTLLCSSTDPQWLCGTWSLEEPGQPPTGPLTKLPVSWRVAAETGSFDLAAGGQRYDCTRLTLPRLPRLAILGAGADAQPLVQFALQLGWQVFVVDHRAAFADKTRFPGADRVVHAPEQRLPEDIDLSACDAVVIMSHNLAADERYLAHAAASTTPYIGLLGPTERKARLLSTLSNAAAVAHRVRGPVGLDLGGEGPEAIALSIVAEIQAALHGKLHTSREAEGTT